MSHELARQFVPKSRQLLDCRSNSWLVVVISLLLAGSSISIVEVLAYSANKPKASTSVGRLKMPSGGCPASFRNAAIVWVLC